MSPDRIAELLAPYTPAPTPQLCAQLALYLDLIEKWNARGPGSPASSGRRGGTNLTAIRTPDEIVRRHFGESLFAAAHIGPAATLLDFGSGAGFPGLPIQLLHPEVAVTLAESQGKKAAFLREAVRTLAVSTEVWPQRVESMPPDRTFDAVALRAVDQMEAAIQSAATRASQRVIIITTTSSDLHSILYTDFDLADPIPIPESTSGILRIAHRR